MGWCLFLLAAFAVYGCIACQSDGSSAAPEAFSGIRNAEDLINSMFKQLSCNGQNCGGYDEPEDEVTIETQPVYPDTDVNEPQYHPQHQTTDKIYVDKPDICESIKEAAVVIESKHPDIANVKTVVMKELVRLTVLFSSVLESEDCHPTVKLLDFIALSAEKLKFDYITLTNNTCVYGEMPVDIGTTAISTHSYEQVSEESYPGATSKQPHHNGIEYQTPETMTGVEDESYPENSLPETSYETSKVLKTRSVRESHKDEQSEEIIAEEDHFYPPFVGSVRGVPGEHYPNYSEIPITSFSCSDKYIPGFYADLETGCQVFHVCYEHRRESFLCPVGTIFNQPILACDYWYSSNCSLAHTYYGVNVKPDETSKPMETDSTVSELISNIIEGGETNYEDTKITESELDDIVKFLPVQVKVFEETSIHSKSEIAPHKHEVEEVASEYFDNILSTATHVVSKTRDALAKIPEPVEVAQVEDEKPVVFKPKIMKPVLPVMAMKKLAAKEKIKLAAAAVPIIAKAKIAAAVPVAKVVAAKAAAVPVAKVVAAKAAAVPVAKVVAAKAAAVPVAKVVAAKAAAVPVAKVVAAKAAAVPVAKVVAAKAAAVPVAKVVAAKAAAVPVAKVVAAKAAAVPVAKVVAAKAAAVPVAKVVAAKAAAVPVSKAAVMKTVPFIAKGKLVAAASKKAVKTPILKAKILAATLPFAKSAILKSTIPVKGKLLALPLAKAKFAASVPLVKAKLFKAASVPLVKAKLFKAASISPLTKKALALGYIKLLKAKKWSLIG